MDWNKHLDLGIEECVCKWPQEHTLYCKVHKNGDIHFPKILCQGDPQEIWDVRLRASKYPYGVWSQIVKSRWLRENKSIFFKTLVGSLGT